MATASELLDLWISTFNSANWAEAERIFAPDGVMDEVSIGRKSTPKQWTEAGQGWFDAFPDAKGTILNRVVSGNQAVGEITWIGTNRGSFNGNGPTNPAVNLHG